MSKNPTAEEQRHINRILSVGCIACHLDNNFDRSLTNPVDKPHHIRDGNGMGQRDHNRVLPLCGEHHTGPVCSIHATRKLFIERYGSEDTLLHIVEMILQIIEGETRKHLGTKITFDPDTGKII